MRVYAGEDCPGEGQLLRAFFAGHKQWEFCLFRDGLSLLQAIHQDVPEAVLLDLTLPGLDGYLLLRLVKFDTALAHIRILGLSTDLDEKVAARVLALGADGILYKPWREEDLLSWLMRA